MTPFANSLFTKGRLLNAKARRVRRPGAASDGSTRARPIYVLKRIPHQRMVDQPVPRHPLPQLDLGPNIGGVLLWRWSRLAELGESAHFRDVHQERDAPPVLSPL